MATANGFLMFLGGYSIFQGNVVGIMTVDYFLVRRGNLHLADLYSRSSLAAYFYTKGFNIWAYAAFVAGFLLPLPGFIGSFGYPIGSAATELFSLGWVLSFVVGGLSYFVLCRVWPIPGQREDRNKEFESLALEQVEGEVERSLESQGNNGEKNSVVVTA